MVNKALFSKLKGRVLVIPQTDGIDGQFAKRLRTETFNMSQNAFSEALGISKKTVEAWESGKNKPDSATRKLLYLLDNHSELMKDLYSFKSEQNIPTCTFTGIAQSSVHHSSTICMFSNEDESIDLESQAIMLRKELFEYLGYTLLHANWNRDSNNFYDSIKVFVENVNLNSDISECSLTYNFSFFKNDCMVSEIKYKSWFRLNDEEARHDLTHLINQEISTPSQYLKDTLLMMIHISFPFVRQAIFNTTNDLWNPVNIPLTDSRSLLDGGVEFNSTSSS